MISPQPFFSPRGTPYSVYYRALIASEFGIKIDLLTYGEGQDTDLNNVRIIRIPRIRAFEPIKIGPSLPKLVLDFILMIWTIILLCKNKYQIVHAHEEAVFFCLILKPIFRFKLIYDMHSSLPQQLTNFSFTKSKVLIQIFKKLEDSCLKAADAIITICPDLCQYVNSVIQNKKKHFLIENSIFDFVKLRKTQSITERTASNNLSYITNPIDIPKNKRIVVYAGTLESYQGIDILIEAFSKVVQTYTDAFLLIVGGQPHQVKYYKERANKNGLEDFSLFTGKVPQQLAKYYISKASVLVSPRSEGTNTPLKIYEQINSGIPLVATNIYSHTQVLNDKVAFLVQPKPDCMAVGICEALKPNGKGLVIAQNAKRLYESQYDRGAYEAKMRSIFQYITRCGVLTC